MPAESRTRAVVNGRPHWSVEAHLLDDLRMNWVHTKKHPAKPHPQRPTGKSKVLNPQAIAAGRKRRAARKAAIEAGEIT